MRKKTLVVVLSLAVLVMGLACLAVLSGCGAKETTTTAAPRTTATTAPPSTTATTQASSTTASTGATTETTAAGGFKGKITVGALINMTGPFAMNGAEIRFSYELAVKDINEAGGIKLPDGNYELVMRAVDSKSSDTEASAAAEKLIKVEGLKIILGAEPTPLNLAAATVANKYNALYLTDYTWTDVARQQNLSSLAVLFFPAGKGGPGETPFLIWDKLPADSRPTRWGIATQDNADGQAIGGALKDFASQHGAQVVEYQSYTPDSKDYSSVILKFKQAKVDALIAFATTSDAITFTKQMKEQNYAPKIFGGMMGFWSTEYSDALGADADYVLHDGFWHPDLGHPKGKEIAEAYAAAHSGKTTVVGGLPYALVQVLAAAIEKAGTTDAQAVRNVIANGTFPGTAMGDLQFDDHGICEIPPTYSQWLGGKRVLIYPGHETELQYMKPWNER